MKSTKSFLLAGLAALSLVFAMSCSSPTSPESAPQAEKVTITYKTDKGTAPEAKKVDKGYKLVDADIKALSADDFTFDGWFNGDAKAKAGDVINTNVTFTAKWTENSGEGGITPTPGADVPADVTGFEKVGEPTQTTINVKWNKVEGADGYKIDITGGKTETVDIASGEIVTREFTELKADTAYTFSIKAKKGDKFSAKAATLTLKTAKAGGDAEGGTTETTYTVVFDNKGKGTKPDNQEGLKAGDAISNPGDLKQPGYIFGGWYDNSECTGDAVDFGSGSIVVDANKLTYHAKWTAKEFTVAFDIGGEVGVSGADSMEQLTGVTLDNASVKSTNNTFKVVGKKFTGWKVQDRTDIQFTDLATLIPTLDVNSDAATAITLVAQWENKKFNITFASGSDFKEGDQNASVASMENVTLKTPSDKLNKNTFVNSTVSKTTFANWSIGNVGEYYNGAGTIADEGEINTLINTVDAAGDVPDESVIALTAIWAE